MGDQGLTGAQGRKARARARGVRAATITPTGPAVVTAAPNLIQIENRQRLKPVARPAVVALVQATLDRLECTGEIGVHLVGPREMARVNWDYLRHEGSTDVITFDHGSTARHLYGECFICVADAIRQAGEWQTEWPDELGRYVIHALLHLAGYDDLAPVARQLMKRRENALTAALVRRNRWLR